MTCQLHIKSYRLHSPSRLFSVLLELRMRPSPSITPSNDQDIYLVLDDFGAIGCAWRETNVQDTELESVITDLLEGQYRNPIRVIGFNTAEGWSRDVSEDVARELNRRWVGQDRELPLFLHEFVDSYVREDTDA